MPEVGSGKAFSLVTATNPYAKDINRLISSISPSGKIVLQEDFENTAPTTIPWTLWNPGTIAYSTAFAFRGQGSLLLTSTAVAGTVTNVRRHFSRLPNEMMGLEFWCRALDADTREIRLGVYVYDGTHLRYCLARYTFATELWAVYTPTGWINIGSFRYQNIVADECWTHLKIIGDPVSGNSVSLECGPTIFDLSGYSARADIADVPPAAVALFGIAPDENVAKTIYVDDLIFTNEEA